MKYYKYENNEVYAYESDGSQDAYIKPGLIPITEEEMLELTKPQPQNNKLVCTRRQGRLALLQSGYLEQVETYINSIEDQATKMVATIEYQADTWENTNAFVIKMWDVLGGTSEGLDNLFILAITL